MKTTMRPGPVLLAILLFSVCLVPVMALKDISPSNELRYLSIADEALENGSVFTFSNHGEPYADKPPLYLWLVMLLRIVFGHHNILALSFLSFIPAMLVLVVMDRWLMLVSSLSSLRFSFGERFAAAMMTGMSAMFAGTAVILRMDMLMTLFIVLSLFIFYRMYKNVGNTVLDGILLPVCIFLALFTKGPVGLLMPVAGIFFFLLFSGRIRDAGKYLGFRTWGILALLCALWFLGVWLEGGTEYLENLLFHQTIDRAVDAFHHKRPFWYYLTAIWYVLAPYSIAMIYAVFSRTARQGYITEAGRLFLISSVSVFVMLSAFSSKLSVYLLPVVPFMAYFTLLAGRNTGCNGWMRFSFSVPSAVLLLVAAAIPLFPLAVSGIPGMQELVPDSIMALASTANMYAAAVLLFAGASFSFWALFRKRSWTMSASSIAVALLLSALALSPLIPEVNDYIGYRNLCTVAGGLRQASGVSGYATLGISRAENMDVFLSEDVRVLDEDDIPDPEISAVSRESCLSDLLGLSDTVLMVRNSVLEDEPWVRDILSGLYSVRSGDYTVFVVKGKPAGLD